jgi:hypothetical protein
VDLEFLLVGAAADEDDDKGVEASSAREVGVSAGLV